MRKYGYSDSIKCIMVWWNAIKRIWIYINYKGEVKKAPNITKARNLNLEARIKTDTIHLQTWKTEYRSGAREGLGHKSLLIPEIVVVRWTLHLSLLKNQVTRFVHKSLYTDIVIYIQSKFNFSLVWVSFMLLALIHL